MLLRMTLASGARFCAQLLRDLKIMREVFRRIRTPQIERILRRVIAVLPILGDRNVVDVAGILGVAAPRSGDVRKIGRARPGGAGSPAVGEALLGHMAR